MNSEHHTYREWGNLSSSYLGSRTTIILFTIIMTYSGASVKDDIELLLVAAHVHLGEQLDIIVVLHCLLNVVLALVKWLIIMSILGMVQLGFSNYITNVYWGEITY